MTMHRFLIVVEKAGRNYSAYAPDLPGCVATGTTRRQAENNMRAAIEMHLAGLADDHLPVPAASATSGFLFVPAETSRPSRSRKSRQDNKRSISKS